MELAKLKGLYGNLAEDKRILALTLCEKLEFHGKTLLELEKDVKKNGAVIVSVNGNGIECSRENPAMKLYNATYKGFLSTVKQLNEISPDVKIDKDDFLDFVKR